MEFMHKAIRIMYGRYSVELGEWHRTQDKDRWHRAKRIWNVMERVENRLDAQTMRMVYGNN